MVKEKKKTQEGGYICSKYFLTLIVLTLLVSPTIFAQEELTEQIPSFQFNTEFDLKRACFDNGFFCSDAFVCNLTITRQDGSLMVNNQQMTNQTSFYNLTVDQADNNQMGFANGLMSCNNVSNAGPDTFVIAITADGKPFRIFPQEYVAIIFAFFMICFGIMNDRLRLFKHVGGILAMVMGVVTLFPGYSFINYSTIQGLSMGTILIGLGFYFLIEDSFSRDKQEDSFDSQSVYVDDDGI